MNVNEANSNYGEYLVVGGDSLVGKALVKELKNNNKGFYSTTRRKDNVSNNIIYLDFHINIDVEIPKSVKYAYIVAAATNYEYCEIDPKANEVNVELIPFFIFKLLKNNS